MQPLVIACQRASSAACTHYCMSTLVSFFLVVVSSRLLLQTKTPRTYYADACRKMSLVVDTTDVTLQYIYPHPENPQSVVHALFSKANTRVQAQLTVAGNPVDGGKRLSHSAHQPHHPPAPLPCRCLTGTRPPHLSLHTNRATRLHRHRAVASH